MSVFRRNNGRWIVKFKDSSGKWVQRSFLDEQTARAFNSEQNDTVEDTELSMGELVVLYLRSNPDLYPETRRRIIWLFADGGPCAFMRDKYAVKLDRQDLERMREFMRARNVTNNTINHYQAYTQMILAWGADQELIVRHPWRDFKKLKVSKPVIQARLEDLIRRYPYLPEYLQWAAKTAFFLALRPGRVELFRLTWNAFNWQRGFVSIRQGKTGRIKTVYPHPAYMAEAADKYQADRRAGIILVCHNKGKPVCSYHKVWGAACRRAGVQLRFYDIRHLAASEMLARGADLAAVSAQLGHASVTTTGSTYAHVTPGGQSHAGALMPAIDVKK